jgi:hypothetical protein
MKGKNNEQKNYDHQITNWTLSFGHEMESMRLLTEYNIIQNGTTFI